MGCFDLPNVVAGDPGDGTVKHLICWRKSQVTKCEAFSNHINNISISVWRCCFASVYSSLLMSIGYIMRVMWGANGTWHEFRQPLAFVDVLPPVFVTVEGWVLPASCKPCRQFPNSRNLLNWQRFSELIVQGSTNGILHSKSIKHVSLHWWIALKRHGVKCVGLDKVPGWLCCKRWIASIQGIFSACFSGTLDG